jgi:hypothetical protein
MEKRCEECKKETDHYVRPYDQQLCCVICHPGVHPDWPKNLTNDELADCMWSSDMFPEFVDDLEKECKRRGFDPFAEEKG